jgi:hypothetical protein
MTSTSRRNAIGSILVLATHAAAFAGRVAAQEQGGVASRPESRAASRDAIEAPATTGRVVLLRFDTAAPVGGRAWTCVLRDDFRRNETTHMRRTDASGAFALPDGEWSITSDDDAFRTYDRKVSVRRGRTTVAFVQEVGELVFRLLTKDGRPITGAIGHWSPERRLDPFESSGEVFRASVLRRETSDADGRVVFRGVPMNIGTATFVAEGYDVARRTLRGGLEESSDVVLTPNADEGRVRIPVVADTNAPADGVLLFDAFGVEIGRCEPGSCSLRTGPGFGSEDSGVLTGPEYLPTSVRGLASKDDALVVYRRCRAKLRVESARPRGSTVVYEIDVVGAPWTRSFVGATIQYPRVVASYIRGGDGSCEVGLPRGLPLRIVARSTDGDVGVLETTLQDATAELTIRIGPDEAPFVVVAHDSDGRPLADVDIETTNAFGRTRRARTAANGAATFGAVGRVRRLRVEAPGFVGLDLRVPSDAARSGAPGPDGVVVVLKRGRSAVVTVRDAAGAPVAGHGAGLFARRFFGPLMPAHAEFQSTEGLAFVGSESPAGDYGVTDADGRFETTNAPPDMNAKVLFDGRIAQAELENRDMDFGLIEEPIVGGRVALEATTVYRIGTIEVVDAADGAPIRRFQVRRGAGLHWRDVDFATDAFWQGVAASDGALAVRAEGYVDARVPASALTGKKPLRIELRREGR